GSGEGPRRKRNSLRVTFLGRPGVKFHGRHRGTNRLWPDLDSDLVLVRTVVEVAGVAGGARRQRRRQGPKFYHVPYHLEEIIQVQRFDDVAVGVERVGLLHIVRVRRAGEDDDRDVFEPGVVFNFRQHRAAVGFGQVQVQQDEVRRSDPGVLPLPVQERQRLLPVHDDGDLLPVAEGLLAQGLLRQEGVGGVIFHKKDVYHSPSTALAGDGEEERRPPP